MLMSSVFTTAITELCCRFASSCGGGQGPCGGMAYIYTRIYTDLEIESGNHITYIVVYTLLVITICYSMCHCYHNCGRSLKVYCCNDVTVRK